MNLMIMLISFFVGDASAVKLAMDAQNRVFVGGAWIDGGYGPTIGLESRLTQLIYINIGGFTSLSEDISDVDSTDQQDWLKLNHGIFAAPGWRVPHRYKEDSVNWDILFRGGFACVFSADANLDDYYTVDPAGLIGVDLYLQKQNFGIRSSNKVFMYQPTMSKTLSSISASRVQTSIELFWQWE
jgi:hypothetical protein